MPIFAGFRKKYGVKKYHKIDFAEKPVWIAKGYGI